MVWLSPNQSVLCIPPADAAAEIRTPTTTIQRGQRGLIRIRRDKKSKKENRTSRGGKEGIVISLLVSQPGPFTSATLAYAQQREIPSSPIRAIPIPNLHMHLHLGAPMSWPPSLFPAATADHVRSKARQSTEARSTCVLLYLGPKRNEKPFGSQPQVSGLQDSGVERGQGSQAARQSGSQASRPPSKGGSPAPGLIRATSP